MRAPNETIIAFLADCEECGRSLAVSIAFANFKVYEFKAALGEWEGVVDTLNEQVQRNDAALN
jgi:hypothetical protein